MNKIEHTPKLTVSESNPATVLCDGTHLCHVDWACACGLNWELDARLAKTIVTACNEHAALVAVAEAARNLTADNGGRALDAALAALAKIRGGAK